MQWSEFCCALHTHFDRDQHEFLLRQLNRICQTSFMQDYVDRFSELVDQLQAYDSSTNALFYITRFLDGLHSDIRVVLLVQRPNSLDTTYTLALLQEEAAEPTRRREFRQWNPQGGYQRGERPHAAEANRLGLCWPRLDLRFRSGTTRGQLSPWPLGMNENAMTCFYNDTPFPFIGKGDSHVLQHILTTKVDIDHIPNTRLGSQGK
jgi:hypothetical protein